MQRRHFLQLIAGLGVGAAGWRFWPEEGIWHPCFRESLPESLRQHEIVEAAWQGLKPNLVWDSHVHLVGLGHSGSGIWVNPKMQSLLYPLQYMQFKFYLNASCVDETSDRADQDYVSRLLELQQDFPKGYKSMLLAFDYRYDEEGRQQKEQSTFHVPNQYAADIAHRYPEYFEWFASIHPYRQDCVQALEQAVAAGTQGVKWLPGAMGIDPSSPRCDRFYEALKRHNLPLLTHAGDEHAVDSADSQGLNNPLLLRRPLEQGVKVIVAHCASIGSGLDLDKGPDGPETPNIELFARLMSERAYESHLFADISAVLQVNRDIDVIEKIFKATDWHPRLINGSDYPLPGVLPLISLRRFVNAGYLSSEEVEVISWIRQYNPLLFDFVLKRRLRIDGFSLPNNMFESASLFRRGGSSMAGKRELL